jgi:hypothetical protein
VVSCPVFLLLTTDIPRRFVSIPPVRTDHDRLAVTTNSDNIILFMTGNCSRRKNYFSPGRLEETVRASGCFGDQSSGGNATLQNVGQAAENSSPTSPLPARTGPRNTTWHSSSCMVPLCFSITFEPLVSRDCIKINAPCALIAKVAVSSSNTLPCASFPRIRTDTCIKTRWLRRRGPA